MTSIIQNDDKILQMFKQYRAVLEQDKTLSSHVRTTYLTASQLTLAHMIDHLVCILKEEEKPTVTKLDGPPKK